MPLSALFFSLFDASNLECLVVVIFAVEYIYVRFIGKRVLVWIQNITLGSGNPDG